MLHKYRIDFKWVSGVQIHPFSTMGVTVEAHTAEDALTQARIEIDEITRRHAEIIPWPNTWTITKIIALPDSTEERKEIER